MGRKKQKVRWTSVDDGFFVNEDEDVVVSCGQTLQIK